MPRILSTGNTTRRTQAVPFDRIKTEHYEPAILEGIKQQNAEIDAIILESGKG